MSNTDPRNTNLSFNEITQELEVASGTNWSPVSLTNPGAGITQLTGDVTAGPGTGSQPTTLKTVNSNVGSFTSANITVNAKGLITAAANGSSAAAPNAVSQVDSTGLSTTSSTPQPTGATVTITPSSNTAKIKISVSGTMQSAAPNTSPAHLTLLKDGTDLAPGNGFATYFNNNDAAFAGVPTSFVWLETPGDTSPHIYTVALWSGDGVTQVRWLNASPDAIGIIIAEEVH